MQPPRTARLGAALLAALAGLAAAAGSGLSPVTRVVELLKDMSVQIEKDGKAEEDLYETFVCWGKSIISQKTKSNTDAQSRVDELETYIADLDAGRVELTTERADLTAQVEGLSGEIEVATEQRNKEKSDYEMAKEEMQQAIDALTGAIEVLKTATDGHASGVLLDMQARLGSSSEARAKEEASIHYAVELGERVLSKGDAVFLRRLLTGEVPTWDWKKLNRKATYKQSYKARSFKIQEVLAKMLETFASNLKDANTKEGESAMLFSQLMGAKNGEKDAAVAALQAMVKENGARGLSKQEATDESTNLKSQIDTDTRYIAEVKQALEDKKKEWKDRQVLRTGELAAISKAISILHNDDSRDLFKKSFASQNYFFLQEGRASSRALLAQSAAEALQAAARQAGDSRLSAVVMSLRSGSHFDEVVKAIDSMIALLKSEETSDLKKKEDCEKARADDTREAITYARGIDDLSDNIMRLKAKIQEIEAEIADKEKQVDEIKAELKEAKDIRDKENKEYVKNKKDDQDAAAVVSQAMGVLQTFYSENGLMLAQQGQRQRQSPFQSTAGEAPPPPPTTWEAPYAGKTEEQMGVLAIMQMIHEDIKADEQKADTEEQKALDLYGKTKAALETERDGLIAAIDALKLTQGDLEKEMMDDTDARRTDKGEKMIVIKRIKELEPGCDWFAINYPLRVQNRHVEIDGLLKAKAILSGGSFTAPQDPDREMKPGDAAALVQGHLRAGRKQVKLVAA